MIGGSGARGSHGRRAFFGTTVAVLGRVAGLILAVSASARGAPAQADSSPAPPADRFANLAEGQLDSVYGPVAYLMRPDERGIYPGLTVAGKRTFLRQFWARRDPTPGTPRNEAEETFNARIAVVNRKFRERGTDNVPGWRTDRGRIFLEYGAPDITLGRRGPGVAVPFDVWKYTRTSKVRKYCFVDLTGFGNYVLVYSNDPAEPSRPQWEVLMGEEYVDEVLRF